jgi:MoxR-like ATPase
MPSPETERVQRQLADHGYIADAAISMSLHLARSLRKPLLVEGPAGVGKTEIAKVLARVLDTDLIRLQCYEGLDTCTALYEWNYQRQLLQIRMEEDGGRTLEQKEAHIFSEPFLLKRPLLQAITHHRPPVLLIDEIDRADEEFESFLLEVLSDWQITIPELGTITATHIPYVIVTGNRTRELSDALRRRCFYLWIDYPDFDKELAIVRARVDGIDAQLAEQICRFMAGARQLQLEKPPGVAETLDWARALVTLHRHHLDAATVEETLGIVFKDYHDVTHMKQSLAEFLESVGVRSTFAPGGTGTDDTDT